ncbi:unnamed protein product [Rotaria magnacalcarata]|uniref:Uncharacterized protein n=1 Tax=Rotaria magnacalcarata TaxID=392030 RepID=A0A816NAY5_9BILA|nr:unnamed protein product [Rotaria magnacalcarata]CAF4057190.1 unnamed protein product [Rotaria magnacalcarata]
MLKVTILIFVQISVLLAVTPNWVGSFNVDQTCDPDRCCCFHGQIIITNRYPTTYTLAAGVLGAASYCGTHHILSFPKPTGFTTMIVSDGDKFHFHLSKDSTKLSITYEQEDLARCVGNAIRD